MAERKVFNFESKILSELTLEKEGFDPNFVGYQKKHIWATCRFCGEPSRLLGFNFKKSGSACHKECRFKEQSLNSPFKNEETRKKAQDKIKTLDRDELNKKISDGRLLSQWKVEETNLEKYGVKNVFQSEEIKEKIRKTNLDKYGVEFPTQNTEIANKISENWKNRTQEEIENMVQKAKRTNIEKLGVDSPLKDLDIRNKAIENLKNTIKENKNDNYDLINILRGSDFWEDIKSKDTLKECCEKYNIDYGSLTARLLSEEFCEKYYDLYSFPKTQKQKCLTDYIKHELSLNATVNDRSVISPLELDVYIPENKFAIEFNGSYWHSEAVLDTSKARNKHIQKTRLCQEKGITLFHIFENTWNLREKQIKCFLKSALGKNEIKIHGRKCIIKEDFGGKDLIEENHIQGFTRKIFKTFDLFHNNEIVGSIGVASHHRTNDKEVLVLSRMAFKSSVTVMGGASKMFSYMIDWAKRNGYKKILSWSDNSWTEGKIYKVLGFELEDELPIDYFYWDAKNNTYVSKQSQKKSANGCPQDVTERDFCYYNGLFRIWDCGKKRWIFNMK